jgi:hypothetical protein
MVKVSAVSAGMEMPPFFQMNVEGATPPDVVAVIVSFDVTGRGAWVTGGSAGTVETKTANATVGRTSKDPVEFTVPFGVMIEIGPSEAPAGTLAVNWVALSTVSVVAETPLNFTSVVPVKPVPVTVTRVPTGPEAGLNPLMVGAAGGTTTVKEALEVPVPAGVVTAMGPVVAPPGTIAVTCVELGTVNDLEAVPLKVTAVAPDRFVPVTATEVPAAPEVGVNPVTVGTAGATVTVKLLVDVPVPVPFITERAPEDAPAGTVAVNWFALILVKVAAVPLNFTKVASKKLVPFTVTTVPTGPVVGLNPVTVGAPVTVVTLKLPVEVPVPAAFVTDTGPDVAPAGTVAVTWLALTLVKSAAIPLKATEAASEKSVPFTVTTVPTGPEVGVKSVTVGPAGTVVTVKLLVEVPVPAALVTDTGPDVAPAGTVAISWVGLIFEKLADAPLKRTEVASEKLVPFTATIVPTGPEVGVNPVTVAAAGTVVTVKLPAEVPVPNPLVTDTGPEAAPAGTVAVSCVGLTFVKFAEVPLNVTAVTSERLLPFTVTTMPTGPEVGVNPVTTGDKETTVTVAEAEALPPLPVAVAV